MISLNSFIMSPIGAVKAGSLNVGDIIFVSDGNKIYERKIDEKIIHRKKVFSINYYSQEICKLSIGTNVLVSDERRKNITKTKKIDSISSHDIMYRKFVKAPIGYKNEPHAYSIGAILGDGCCTLGGNSIFISSSSDVIPKNVGNQLGAKYVRKNKGNNFTYTISNGIGHAGNRGHDPVICHHYIDWCKNKYAHEKIIDIQEIKKWSRESLVNLICGLLDTDGSVEITGGRLTIKWFSQSKSIIDAIFYIILSIWQVEASICISNESKYVNGPVYIIYIRKNLFSKKILNDCRKFLLIKNKNVSEIKGKGKDEYIYPRVNYSGISNIVDFGINDYIITANQGVLFKKER